MIDGSQNRSRSQLAGSRVEFKLSRLFLYQIASKKHTIGNCERRVSECLPHHGLIRCDAPFAAMEVSWLARESHLCTNSR